VFEGTATVSFVQIWGLEKQTSGIWESNETFWYYENKC